MKLAAPIFRSLIRVRGAYVVCTRGKQNPSYNSAPMISSIGSRTRPSRMPGSRIAPYRVESIKNVDRILRQPRRSIHQGSVDDQRPGTRLALGAPIGEVNRRSEPGAHSATTRSVKVFTR